MADTVRIQVFSGDSEKAKGAVNRAKTLIHRKGGETNIPQAKVRLDELREVAKASAKEDLPKEHQWGFGVVGESTIALLEKYDPENVYCHMVEYHSRIDLSPVEVMETLVDVPEGVVIQISQGTKDWEFGGQNAPFSYDPNNDYYTEPWNY